jgi:L-arabinokinase
VARATNELADLERRNARLIVTDVPSFPLTLAARLGVPGVCVANFTWADIYAELGQRAEPGLAPVAERLAAEYAQATLLLDAGLSLPMPYFPRRANVGIVARPHRDRRDELVRHLGVDDHKRIALLYVGDWGLPLRWPLLETFSPHWHFVSLSPPPVSMANLTVLPQTALPHPDLVASCDLVISKPGYGLVGECLSSGTPLLYCPRVGFAEYAALDAALSSWRGGLRLSTADFMALNWRAALEQVPARGSVPEVATNGGPHAAAQLTQIYRDGKLPVNFVETAISP